MNNRPKMVALMIGTYDSHNTPPSKKWYIYIDQQHRANMVHMNDLAMVNRAEQSKWVRLKEEGTLHSAERFCKTWNEGSVWV